MSTHPPLHGALTEWHRSFAKAFASAVPLEQPAAAAVPETDDEPLCRYLVIVGNPGERGYQREVIEAYCEDELLTPEKAGVLHDLAQSLGLGFKFRAVTCEDPEHDDSRADEHEIEYRDGRDPDVKVPHYACRWCARCELAREDFAS